MWLTRLLLLKELRSSNPGVCSKSESASTPAVDVSAYFSAPSELESTDSLFLSTRKICRLCSAPANTPLLDKPEGFDVVSAVRVVTNITIATDDCYPKYVCDGCLVKLKALLTFKRKCERTNMMFRQMVQPEYRPSDPVNFQRHDFTLFLQRMMQRRAQRAQMTLEKERKLKKRPRKIVNQFKCVSCDIPFYNRETLQSHRAQRACARRPCPRCRALVLNLPLHVRRVHGAAAGVACARRAQGAHAAPHGALRLPVRAVPVPRQAARVPRAAHAHAHGRAALPVRALPAHLHQREQLPQARARPPRQAVPGPHAPHYTALVLMVARYGRVRRPLHTERYDYPCELCPYRGKRRAYLALHMRTHTGERPYLCARCPLTFTNASNFRKHALVHRGKPFQCSKCNKLFRSAKSLREHDEGYHLKILHPCAACGKTFTYRSLLLRHERKVHKRARANPGMAPAAPAAAGDGAGVDACYDVPIGTYLQFKSTSQHAPGTDVNQEVTDPAHREIVLFQCN